MSLMRDIADLFAALEASKFRRRFQLAPRELQYINQRGLGVIIGHAREFIEDRLASPNPKNDGRQTPMRGHPVFIAQHATATCCRSCLEKWHGIAKGKGLSESEVDYIIRVLSVWIKRQCPYAMEPKKDVTQRELFD
jgi:hypothetical protein